MPSATTVLFLSFSTSRTFPCRYSVSFGSNFNSRRAGLVTVHVTNPLLPFSSPGVLPNPGIEPGSPALQADSSPSEPPGKPLQSAVVGRAERASFFFVF